MAQCCSELQRGFDAKHMWDMDVQRHTSQPRKEVKNGCTEGSWWVAGEVAR